MRKLLTTAAIGLGLIGAAFTTADAAAANTNECSPIHISFSLGDVAYGYTDGYWDHQHHWHRWQRASDRTNYRKAPTGEYHAWGHNRDRRNQGWHGDSNGHG